MAQCLEDPCSQNYWSVEGNEDEKRRKLMTNKYLSGTLASPLASGEETELTLQAAASPKISTNSVLNEIHKVTNDDLWPEIEQTVFFDFEKQRKSAIFGKGEVWAVYDEYGVPRRYAQILTDSNSHLIPVQFLIQKEWDRSRWYNPSGALLAHGIFVVQGLVSNLEYTAFSHKVQQGVMRNANYYIYPRKGEVWVITKGIDDDTFKMGSPTTEEYQIVEVLEDFSVETGVRVVYMTKVQGYKSIFRRYVIVDDEESNCVPPNELCRFSHQVPYAVVSGESALVGCFELDPSSLPLYIDNFDTNMTYNIDDTYLCLGLLDWKIRMRQSAYKNGTVWAVHDGSNGLPLKHVVLDSITTQPDFSAKMFSLEFHPVSEDEKRWYKAGLPISCGYFKRKDSVQENLPLSHPVFYRYEFFELVGNSCYYISPRARDVWALYKNMDSISITCGSIMKENLEYDIVEIIGIFGKQKRAKGIKARYLERVEGYKNLFTRNTDFSNIQIPWEQLYRFSHHIPSYKFHCAHSFHNNSFVLDPVLVPAKDGNDFILSDPPLLKVSKAYPLSSAIKHFMGKEITNEDLEQSSEISEEENIEETDEAVKNFSWVNSTLTLHYSDNHDISKDFEPGHVWAIYNDYDGIPRSYARIDAFLHAETKVEMSLLEFYPTNGEEIKWAEDNWPMTCGAFRTSKTTFLKDLSVLSHRIFFDNWEGVRSFYKIYPKKSEVWALYKNWDADWTESSFKNYYEYKLVVIVSDFNEDGELSVAALRRVDGCEATFERQLHEGFALIHKFSRNDFPRFSHRIPSVKGMGVGTNSVFKELWKMKFTHKGI